MIYQVMAIIGLPSINQNNIFVDNMVNIPLPVILRFQLYRLEAQKITAHDRLGLVYGAPSII